MEEKEKSLQTTPFASRVFIGIFGRMNAGKSSLVNAFSGQGISIVSDTPGTTTDVVKRPMEIHGIGPCVLLDTAGFDDEGMLGSLRTEAARRAAEKTDLAVILFTGEEMERELTWVKHFRERKVPVVPVVSRCDELEEDERRELLGLVREKTGTAPVAVSSRTGEGLDELKEALIRSYKAPEEKRFILGNLVREKDVVMLVMPQDPQAPEGRLILPEVQTIREGLDRHCILVCIQPEEMEGALAALKEAPKLIVTDSQIFDRVYAMKPAESKLTSFSILFAGLKGDIGYYAESAKAIDTLTEDSKVLIAECCTHAPLDEDIGRVKIPAMLRKKTGQGLQVDICAGVDFPENVGDYDLVIQCGGCMFNRRFILSRTDRARDAGVPMTNYGIAIAYMKGILDRVDLGRACDTIPSAESAGPR